MLAEVPWVVSDVAQWCLAIAAVGTVLGGASKLFLRSFRRVIREEVPQAVAETFPDVTRAMIREEVSHVTEPMFAGLRAELKPNGGSSFSDLVNKRLDAQDARLKGLEDGQQQIVDRMDGGA